MKKPMIVIAFIGVLTASAVGATALVDGYLDDRSDAAALVNSFYNAINRKEYARAWSYYHDSPPAANFATFEEETMDIERADVVIGEIVADGAAGSVFYQVPVAVRLTRQDASETYRAGCFVARLSNPQIQGDPFMPLHFESDGLTDIAAPASLEAAVPANCE
jgi:hypothetical protein